MLADAWEEAKHRTIAAAHARYQRDPVAFGEEVLGERFTDDVRRLMQSVVDYPITIAKSANATGKTHAAARIAIWFYKAFEEAQVYTAAAPPEANLKTLLWGEIDSVVEAHRELFEDDRALTMHVSRSSREFITGTTIPTTGTTAQREARFSGKHAPHMLFIVDEGDAVPPEVYKGIESCMSGGHARLLVLFNPRHQAGTLWQMERDGLANVVELTAFDHPNVVSGEEVIPGAVDREKTVRRINEWTRPLRGDEKRTSECFDVPDFLVGAVAHSTRGQPYPPLAAGVRKVTNAAFSYMVLAQYPGQSSRQLVSREWVEAAVDRWRSYVAIHGESSPQGVRPIHGQDVAEFGVDDNVSCLRYGGWVPVMKRWGGVDPVETAERSAVIHKESHAQRTSVDGTGVGAGVAPYMRRKGCNAQTVKVAESPTVKALDEHGNELGTFAQLRDQLYWMVREWLRTDPTAMLPPSEELQEELVTPTYEIRSGKIKVMDKDTMRDLLKRSPDELDALALTFAPTVGARAGTWGSKRQ